MNVARSAAVEAAAATGALPEHDEDAGYAEVQSTAAGADGGSDDERSAQLREQYPLGSIVDGVVMGVKPHAVVCIRVADSDTTGLLHYSEVTKDRVFVRRNRGYCRKVLSDLFKVGDRVKVRGMLCDAGCLHPVWCPTASCAWLQMCSCSDSMRDATLCNGLPLS